MPEITRRHAQYLTLNRTQRWTLKLTKPGKSAHLKPYHKKGDFISNLSGQHGSQYIYKNLMVKFFFWKFVTCSPSIQ